MDDLKWKVRLGWFLLLGLLSGCGSSTSIPVDAPFDTRETLDAVGRRLSRSMSERELTALATHGDALVRVLNSRERSVLGQGYLRFRVTVPAVMEVAVPDGNAPFWLADQGFEATQTTLRTTDTGWTLYRKAVEPGWVGLGVNGLDRKPPVHYVVLLRSGSGRSPLTTSDVELTENQVGRWRKVVLHAGVSTASDVFRPFQSVPDEFDGTILLQPRHDERHSSLLASGRVWKTHVPSSPQPDQVTIAFGSDPRHELVWSWRTSTDVKRTAVRLVPARFEAAENDPSRDPDLTGLRVVQGASTLLRWPGLLNDPVVRRHSVTVEDLTPDTLYFYSLSDGSKTGWGPWRTVKTGPANPRRIEFLYMGDAQTGLQEWGRRLETAFSRHPGTDLILLAGDLVDRGNERTNWDHFFLRSAQVFERLPLMPCVGNHEYLDQGPTLYRAFFELPKNGPRGTLSDLVYHFEYGNAFFAVLDSTPAVFRPEEARRQAQWLDQALSRTQADWKFVMFHHPVYASHPRRVYPLLSESWVPIFDKHHVDLVLQGHDHAYLRTYPMHANRRVSGPEVGTVYVVSVSGDKFAEQSAHDYAEVSRADTSTYQTIEIDEYENRLTYRAWTDDGKIADSFVITKPSIDRRERIASPAVPGLAR